MSQNNRYTYLLLLLAAVANLFVFGRWSVPLVAWIMPVFLVAFLRRRQGIGAFWLAWLALGTTSTISGRGVYPLPSPLDLPFVFFITLSALLPYVADRRLAPRVGGFLGTLVLPTAIISLRLFDTLTSPYGTWGNEAYYQMTLPLAQLGGIVGIWGILFLVYWFAAVVNWAWEAGWEWSTIRSGTAIFVVVLAAAFAASFWQQQQTPAAAAAVRVATVVPGNAYLLEMLPREETAVHLKQGAALPAADEAALRENMAAFADELFSQSRLAAADGAQIIVWPEATAWVLATDEADFLVRAQTFAREEDVYLAMGMATFHTGRQQENKLVLVTPAGEVAWSYHKSKLVAFAESPMFVSGSGQMPVWDTPFGRIGGAICHDADHHTFVQQAAAQNVDLLLIPTGDWVDIREDHLQMARMRAIEQGITVVRATRGGISAAIAANGRIVDSLDSSDAHLDGTLLHPHAPPSTDIMVTDLPVTQRTTLYSRIGDAFAWLSAAAFVLLAALALQRSRPVVTPVTEPAAT